MEVSGFEIPDEPTGPVVLVAVYYEMSGLIPSIEEMTY
jgi:hypothetical protein